MGPGAFSVATGDFNGDGIVDLVSANQGNNTVSVVLGNAVGGFNAAVGYATGPTPSAIITGDFNNDGILDLAVTDANCSVQGYNPSIVCDAGSVSILLGNGDGTFQPHADYALGKGSFGIAAGDFNGDGKLDLAIVNNDNTVYRPARLGGALRVAISQRQQHYGRSHQVLDLLDCPKAE